MSALLWKLPATDNPNPNTSHLIKFRKDKPDSKWVLLLQTFSDRTGLARLHRVGEASSQRICLGR